MKTYRRELLPTDLKSFTGKTRHKDLCEALRTFVALILMAAIFLLVMFAAAIPPDPLIYPKEWEQTQDYHRLEGTASMLTFPQQHTDISRRPP